MWKKPIWEKMRQAQKPVFEKLGYRFEKSMHHGVPIGLWRKRLDVVPAGAKCKRLVWVAGFGDAPFTWQSVLISLQGTFKHHFDEVILLDLPGFQGYLSNEPCPRFGDLRKAVFTVLEKLAPDVLFGHSLGAWLSADFAAEMGKQGKHDCAPSELILASPSGVFGDEKLRRKWVDLFQGIAEQGMDVMRPHLFAKEPVWFPLLAWQVEEFFKRPEVYEFIRSSSIKREGSYVARYPLDERLKFIECPVHILWGEEDTLASVKWLPVWMRTFHHHHQRAVSYTIAKHGHSLHIECPLQTSMLLKMILTGRKASQTIRSHWKISATQSAARRSGVSLFEVPQKRRRSETQASL